MDTARDEPQPASNGWWTGDLEQLLSGRILSWVGGLAIMIGAVFFLSLAFSRGWIGPGLRVTIGVVASALMIGGGAWFFERRERVLGHVLVAVGLGIMSVSMLAATALYDLIPPAAGLVGTLIVVLAAAAIAIRANSQVVALFGLIAALAAPPVQNAPVAGTTVLFLALVLCGTTAIALYRTWSWLPPVAFLLAAPQLGVWIVDDAPIAAGLIALSGFWLLNAVAAGGEEYRLRDARRALRPVSATLLLANVTFLVACGFTLIPPESEGGRALFLVGVALAHAAIAGWFFRTEGDRHPFGLLAAGTGLAAFSIAIPVWLGGPVVPVAWAAQAVALTWVATRRQHTFSAVVATLLGLGAIAHLSLFEYPFWRIFEGDVVARPFFNASGGTLLFILGALAVAGTIARWLNVRLVLGGVGFALLIYAMPFELSGMALLAAWSLLFVLSWTGDQWHDRLPGFRSRVENASRHDLLLRHLLVVPVAVSGMLAVLHAFVFEMPLNDLTTRTLPETPFWTEQGAGAGILIVALLAFAAISREVRERHGGIVAAFVIAALLMPFELEPAWMVLAWSVLALALFALPRFMPSGMLPFITSGAVLVAFGFVTTLDRVAPPTRLFVDAGRGIDHPLFWSSATATLGAVAAVLAFAGWLYRGSRLSRWTSLLCGVTLVYLLSVGTVDIFQGRVGGQVAVESLQKQAQVALSILWTVLGVGLFVAGIIRRVRTLRMGGLALLGLSTAKVFVYDLASLDASYRVLSFIGLGILLLASSWAYQRAIAPELRHPGDTTPT